jgi:hypothetical protein
MATINITGPIEVCDDRDDEPITDPARLQKCDGVEEKRANLAEYLDGELSHLGLGGGDLKLRFDAKKKQVFVVSTYLSPRKLSAKELKALVDFTRGQWSDGAGEGAFYKLMDKQHFGIDLTPSGSEKKTRVQQTDVGGAKLKPTPALLVAAEKGDAARVEKLLAAGADINSRGKYGQTALYDAILHDHPRLAATLIARGADVNRATKDGLTPLAAAAMVCDSASAKRLVQAGANVNLANKEGVTPLMWAANRGSAVIVKLLLEHGADPNAKDRVKYNEGTTALMYVQPGSKGIVEMLIANGAKVSQRDGRKQSAVEHALDQARAFDEFGDKREGNKYRKLAEQLKKYQK